MKSVSKSTHRNLKEAFDTATNAEKRAKRFEGLSGDGAAIMTVKADKHKVNQITADTRNHQHHTVTQVSSAPNANLMIQCITTGRRNLITIAISVVKEATILENVQMEPQMETINSILMQPILLLQKC